MRNAPISYDQRYPIVLPAKHKLTKLIIRHYHHEHLHAGPQALLAFVRTSYWPLSGRSAVRRVLRNCVTCFRAKPITGTQLMGDLQSYRITPARPFLHVGVDYAGPLTIKLSRRQKTKAYICAFVCLASKAIHVEAVSDLSTASFLNALKRFTSRRGKCISILSDNATNFVDANNQLKELYEQLSKEDHNVKVQNFLAEQSVNCEFIPPRSPHQGSIWEAAIKSIKTHLRKILGTTLLTFEELSTVLTQIGACLNSRPLTPLSSDLTALTSSFYYRRIIDRFAAT